MFDHVTLHRAWNSAMESDDVNTLNREIRSAREAIALGGMWQLQGDKVDGSWPEFTTTERLEQFLAVENRKRSARGLRPVGGQ